MALLWRNNFSLDLTWHNTYWICAEQMKSEQSLKKNDEVWTTNHFVSCFPLFFVFICQPLRVTEVFQLKNSYNSAISHHPRVALNHWFIFKSYLIKSLRFLFLHLKHTPPELWCFKLLRLKKKNHMNWGLIQVFWRDSIILHYFLYYSNILLQLGFCFLFYKILPFNNFAQIKPI